MKAVTRSVHPYALIFLGAALLLFGAVSIATAAKSGAAPTKQADLLIIGDRLVDVAYHLGVVPAAMSARGSMWPLARDIGRQGSRLLGCPNCVIKKKPTAIPDAVKELGIRRILVEKSPVFCLYKPEVSPDNVVRHLKKMGADDSMGATIETVDFGKGLADAIRQTGDLLGRKDAAEALIKRYEDQLAKAKTRLPEKPAAASVAVFNGVYQQDTGKAFVRLEMPGGYSDRFLLEPLGHTNVGTDIAPKGAKVDKGLVTLRKLDGLVRAAPDIIVLTGDADAVQRLLTRETARNLALRDVPALRNAAIYTLPRYVDSGVIEYPGVLQRWAAALASR